MVGGTSSLFIAILFIIVTITAEELDLRPVRLERRLRHGAHLRLLRGCSCRSQLDLTPTYRCLIMVGRIITIKLEVDSLDLRLGIDSCALQRLAVFHD